MKRLHVHMGVKKFDDAVTFYNAIFGEGPVKLKAGYAKWAPADLGVNFVISQTEGDGGIGHLGVEVQEDDELTRLGMRLRAVDAPLLVDGDVSCCYAKSKKAWSEDPGGITWELFHTYGEDEAFQPKRIGSDKVEGFEGVEVIAR
ncbi:MAG: glyoxalase/bleomycin resistance/dioxygenase family protein [Kordiimonadales bacterium]|nr:MAG: glyoxalase/bleomycin resistance/dioxygenase family protein [Kordiimonadales bacterium]